MEISVENRGAQGMSGEEEKERDELAESLKGLFSNLSTIIKAELQGTNNQLELLEKMNLKVAEEYMGFGDVASGLRVFVAADGRMMIPDCHKRLEAALADLKGTLAELEESNQKEGPEIDEARNTITEVEQSFQTTDV